MTLLNIDNKLQKVLVIGPIYNKVDKLIKIKERFDDYDLIIFNGNLLYSMDGIQDRIDIMNEYLKSDRVLYNFANYDLISLNNGLKIDWIRYNAIQFKISGTNIIVTGGGIAPWMNNISDNIEISFVSNINGRPWHRLYCGSFGYIVSNNPLTIESPKVYDCSIQIGNRIDGEVYAQEIMSHRLGKTILL